MLYSQSSDMCHIYQRSLWHQLVLASYKFHSQTIFLMEICVKKLSDFRINCLFFFWFSIMILPILQLQTKQLIIVYLTQTYNILVLILYLKLMKKSSFADDF